MLLFVEAAALRPIVLRYAGVPIATRVFYYFYFFPFFLIYLEMSLFLNTYYTFSAFFFFYLVTTGWIFDLSLCENSINQSIKDKSAELASRTKTVRREPRRDEEILRDHRQDGNVPVGGTANPSAR